MNDFSVWCDQCGTWVLDFVPCGSEILCARCANGLLRKLPTKRQKKTRMSIAKAIWHLP
jgi:hypothetical protein